MRVVISVIFIWVFFVAVPSLAHAGGKSQTFSLPYEGLTIPIPSGYTPVDTITGPVISLSKGSGNIIRLFKIPVKYRGPKELSRFVTTLYDGITVKIQKKISIAKQNTDVLSAVGTSHYDAPVNIVAYKFFVNDRPYALICDAGNELFTDISLQCQHMIEGIKTYDVGYNIDSSKFIIDTPTATGILNIKTDDRGKRALYAEISASYAVFSMLDGLMGCELVDDRISEDLKFLSARKYNNTACILMSALERGDIKSLQNCNIEIADNLNDLITAYTLEDEGRTETSREIYTKLSKGQDGDFARIALARIALSEGDVSKARQYFRQTSDNYASLVPLKIWADRLESKSSTQTISKMNLCGRSGAEALHQLGISSAATDPGNAITQFTRAIEIDPTYSPSYISLARLYLESGRDIKESKRKILALFSTTPKTPDLERIRKELVRQIGQ